MASNIMKYGSDIASYASEIRDKVSTLLPYLIMDFLSAEYEFMGFSNKIV